MSFKEIMAHTLIGGMTTDYFGFYCEKCKERVDPLEFLGLDPAVPKFKGICPECKDEFEFKIQVRKGIELMNINPKLEKHYVKK